MDEVKEEKNEEFFEAKKDKKSTFNRVMNIVLWIVLFIWMGICLVDFFLTKAEKEPIFCLSKNITEYDDGQVRSCTGLGYKIYHYERDSYNGIEYGPFWSKDRSANKED